MAKEIDSDSYWQGCADSLSLLANLMLQTKYADIYKPVLDLMLAHSQAYKDKISEGKKYEHIV